MQPRPIPFVLAILLALLSYTVTASTIEPALYRVESGQHRAYLFGSVHFGKPDYYPLPSAVLKAFNSSPILLSELDATQSEPQHATQLIQRMGTLPASTTLKQQLSPLLYQRLRTQAQAMGLPMAQLSSLQPWLAALTLSQVYYLRSGLRPDLGIDKYFEQQAKQQSKVHLGLETLEAQLTMLRQLDQQQDALLKQTLTELETPEYDPMMLFQLWEQGRQQALHQFYRNSLDNSEISLVFEQTLLIERNLAWVPQIKRSMLQEQTFVVVGALHLGGPLGLIRLLESEGLRVTRVRY